MKRRNFLRYSIAGSALLSAFPYDECLQFHTAAKFIDGFTLGIENLSPHMIRGLFLIWNHELLISRTKNYSLSLFP